MVELRNTRLANTHCSRRLALGGSVHVKKAVKLLKPLGQARGPKPHIEGAFVGSPGRRYHGIESLGIDSVREDAVRAVDDVRHRVLDHGSDVAFRRRTQKTKRAKDS